MRFATDQFYFKDPQAMETLFAGVPEAISNTLTIAEQCNVKLDFDQYHLPRYAPPAGTTAKEYLRQLCEEGLAAPFPGRGRRQFYASAWNMNWARSRRWALSVIF